MGNECQAEGKYDGDDDGFEQFKALQFEYERQKGRMCAQDMMGHFFVVKGEEKDEAGQEDVFRRLKQEYSEQLQASKECTRTDSEDMELYRCCMLLPAEMCVASNVTPLPCTDK